MAYATLTELENRLGSAAYHALYATDAPAQADLDAAAAEIDGSLAFRYAPPVTGSRSLTLVGDWNLTLAEERAAARSAGDAPAGSLRGRVELVRHYLALIRAGEFALPDETEKGAAPGGIALIQCDAPVFGRGASRGF